MADGRIFQLLNDLAHLGGGIDMRHHDPQRAIIQRSGCNRILPVRDTSDGGDTGVQRGGGDLGTGLKRHDAVLHIEEQPVEPGGGHRLGDFHAAGHADADPEGQMASL
jgi:hypothetical protein